MIFTKVAFNNKGKKPKTEIINRTTERAKKLRVIIKKVKTDGGDGNGRN